MKLSKKFINTVLSTWGIKGSNWLNELEHLISYFSDLWKLTDLQPFTNLSYNYVLHGYSTLYACEVVLKLSLVGKDFINEQKALIYYSGKGCVKLLAFHREKGALLLQSLKPGISLKTLFPQDDMQAAHYAFDVMQALHQGKEVASINEYPSINDWYAFLYEFDSNKLPQKNMNKARTLAQTLLNSQKNLYLLHGDLHHDNILLKSQQWVAIDPKGVLGELAYEVGAFIRNPIKELIAQENAQELIARRLNFFSHSLHIERQRLAHWSYVQAVLAACWSLADNLDNYEQWLICAELISYSFND
jgi:streptomycin 6-kinase